MGSEGIGVTNRNRCMCVGEGVDSGGTVTEDESDGFQSVCRELRLTGSSGEDKVMSRTPKLYLQHPPLPAGGGTTNTDATPATLFAPSHLSQN